ncbi:hypothetical protein VTJ49DRAFT_5273 [Mycothermus thermophilus]|uniref:Uncharacterized protein n=1 Tax=Humicola insolens TaxID=85995 RepID=A0ABR3VM06_HUMIN
MATANPNPDEINLVDDDQEGDYEVAIDPDMAATMGFTSFGGTKPAADNNSPDDADGNDESRPSKKRRFNPHADDAIIAPPVPEDVVSANRAQANKAKGKGKQKSKDDISYSDSDFELDLNDSGTPSRASHLAATLVSNPPGTVKKTTDSGRNTPASQARDKFKPLPTRDGRRPNQGSFSAPAGHNPLWYVDYYDPSFNENPWEGMEKFKGLEPVGTFLARKWDREDKKVPESAGHIGG